MDNQLINELAEQANYLATEKEFPYDHDWFYLYNKTFAGLIVKECASISKLEQDFYNERNDGVVNSDIGELIKHRFGITQ